MCAFVRFPEHTNHTAAARDASLDDIAENASYAIAVALSFNRPAFPITRRHLPIRAMVAAARMGR